MAAPTPTLHAQVLALRRTHSARAVAIAVLRVMAKNEMFDRSETDAVLENLVG